MLQSFTDNIRFFVDRNDNSIVHFVRRGRGREGITESRMGHGPLLAVGRLQSRGSWGSTGCTPNA